MTSRVNARKYIAGEPVIIKCGFVVCPGVVINDGGHQVDVAVAPEGNLTEARDGFKNWTVVSVERRRIKSYSW